MPTWLRVLIPAVLILLWFGAFGAGGASFGTLSDVVENDQSQFLPADAESTAGAGPAGRSSAPMT